MTKRDKDLRLNDQQKEIIFATIMSDGWIEKGSTYKNARVGFQQSVKNIEYFMLWCEIMKPWISENIKELSRTPPNSNKSFKQLSVRTKRDPEFTLFFNEFRPNNIKKTIPKYSFLIKYLTFESFAHILMQDGSIKSSESKGMEIHYQSYSKEALIRLCIAIYNILNIKASVTYYGLSKEGEKQDHIYISGDSYNIIKNNVFPFIHPSMQYKVPTERTKLGELKQQSQQKNSHSTWESFYNKYKDSPCLENIEFILQSEDLTPA